MGYKILVILISTTVLFLLCAKESKSYSAGAPAAVCKTMEPGHGRDPQTSPLPYVIKLDKTSVKGGQPIHVTLSSSSQAKFHGFFALGALAQPQSNSYRETEKAYGKLQTEDKQLKYVKCQDTPKSALTHANSNPKDVVEFDWVAPNQDGEFVILVSFVQDFNTYWIRVPSEKIRVSKDAQLVETSLPSPSENSPSEISSKAKSALAEFYSGCGTTKGCFGLPSGCVSAESCTMMTTFQNQGGRFVFQVAGKLMEESGYVANGLSFDDKMGQDVVTGCFSQNGSPTVGSYYNIPDGKVNSGLQDPKEGVQVINVKQIDGYIFCEFTRSPSFNKQEIGREFNLTSNEFHILLSRGLSASPTVLSKHPNAEDRGVSPNAVPLSYIGILDAKSDILIELHASFMIIAWLLCASTGMFTARYYKQTHTSLNPLNKAFWFLIHITCMFTTVCLTICGIIFIFVEIGGYSQGLEGPGSWHPVLGLILLGLAVCQVIIAFFRPHPGTSKRPFFNWIHWIIGNSAHIVGIACIFLAEQLSKGGLNGYKPYIFVLVGFVIFHVVMHVVMSIHTVWADKQMDIQNRMRAARVGPMKPSGKSEEAPGTGFRTAMLTLYLIGAAAVAITLVCFVASHL